RRPREAVRRPGGARAVPARSAPPGRGASRPAAARPLGRSGERPSDAAVSRRDARVHRVRAGREAARGLRPLPAPGPAPGGRRHLSARTPGPRGLGGSRGPRGAVDPAGGRHSSGGGDVGLRAREARLSSARHPRPLSGSLAARCHRQADDRPHRTDRAAIRGGSRRALREQAVAERSSLPGGRDFPHGRGGRGMSPGLAAAVVAGAYLLGSVSFSVLIVRLLQGLDVRTVGSGNAGATNVLRAAGRKAGVIVLALDVAKGVTAVAVPRALDASPSLVGGAAVAVVLGHVFPVFFGFRGGKGVATSAGALGTLAPAAMALGLVVFVLVVAWKRYVSLGSIVTAALLPLLVVLCQRLGWVKGNDTWLVVPAAAIALIIIARHARNLRRLRQGTEPRLGERRSVPAEEAEG